mgnify:CR=1 FL=1
MVRFKSDDCKLRERLCQVAGVNSDTLKDVLQRLAERGLEVRVELGRDRNGRPYYARRGRDMEFKLPRFPASVRLPVREGEKYAEKEARKAGEGPAGDRHGGRGDGEDGGEERLRACG